ncbi:MAG: hypothetical protein U0R17_05455 [Acidimicrobiia bacterium]
MIDFKEPFVNFKKNAFRLETLPEYRVDYETKLIEDYLAGKPVDYSGGEIDWWLDMVSSKTSQGLTMSRVHVVSEPLTDYLRFELGAAYPITSAAGEEIRLISEDSFDDLCDEDEFDVVFNRWGALDFWLFDDERLFIMDYADDGSWLGVNESFDNEDIKDAMRIRDAVMTESRAFFSL